MNLLIAFSRGRTLWGSHTDEKFGQAVALSGDGSTLVVGVPGSDTAAKKAGDVAVYVYLQGSRWVLAGAPVEGKEESEGLGGSVAIATDGGTLAMGASANPGLLGRALVLSRGSKKSASYM